jgi:hypothetical protein
MKILIILISCLRLIHFVENWTGNAFEWITDQTLFNGIDYGLELTQGQVLVISNRFTISNGTDAAGLTTTPDTLPSNTTGATVSSSPLPTNLTSSANSQATPTTARTKTLGKSEIVGIVMGVMAICVALSVMGIFALVLKMMKKNGPPPGADDHEANREMHDDNQPTELNSPTDDTDAYFPKHSSMMPMGKLSANSTSTNVGKLRTGSASSSNVSGYEIGSPETLVPPRRDLGMIDGMSLDYNHSSTTSAAASLRNETLHNTEEPPSPVEPEENVGRPIRSWMAGDDGFSVGLGHPGNPYQLSQERQSMPNVTNGSTNSFYLQPNGSQGQRNMNPTLTGLSPQMTGDSSRTLTNPMRWSPTSPPAPSNLRFQMDRE